MIPKQGTTAKLICSLAALAIISACSLWPLSENRGSSVPDDFRLVQDGYEIAPNNGVYTLARRPFAIKYRGKKGAPSVFVTTNPTVKKQVAQLHGPLLAWLGTGLFADHGDLYVSEKPLELFEGWSTSFENEWGSIFTPKNRAAFQHFFQNWRGKPILLASGRDYVNFVEQADGTSLFKVVAVGGNAFPDIPFTVLHLLFFVDAEVVGDEIKPYALFWSAVQIEFRDTPR